MAKVKLDDIASYLKKTGVDAKTPDKNPFGFLSDSPQAPPAPKYPEVNYTVVTDSDHPKVKTCVVEENGSVTLYVPEGWQVRGLKDANLHAYMQQGEKEIAVTKVAVVGFDPMNQRTCVWYSPGADHVRDFGAELGEHYEFDRAQGLSTCSNPEIIKRYGVPNPACESEGRMSDCSEYKPEQWEIERRAELELEDGSNVSIFVQTVRKGIGLRLFRILKQTGDNLPVILDQLSSIDHKDKIHDVLNEFYAARIKELEPTKTELVEQEETKPERKYFEYVLAER